MVAGGWTRSARPAEESEQRLQLAHPQRRAGGEVDGDPGNERETDRDHLRAEGAAERVVEAAPDAVGDTREERGCGGDPHDRARRSLPVDAPQPTPHQYEQ